MQLRGLIFVGACLSASTDLAKAMNLPLGSDAHMAGSSLSNETLNPLIMQFNLYKDRMFVKSCYGAHINKAGEQKVLWLLPAECLDRSKSDMIAVKYGYKGNPSARFLLKDIDIRIHPNYNETTKVHNIAVVSLRRYAYMIAEKSYKFTQLPSSSDNFDNKTLEVYEYENTKYDVYLQEKVLLYTINTKPINPLWCKVLYPLSPIKKHGICASGWAGKGLSKDNLGVPLIRREGAAFTLAGVTTIIRPWTYLLSFPIEFLNIQPYLDWILYGKTGLTQGNKTRTVLKPDI